jgi:hypothetical protein
MDANMDTKDKRPLITQRNVLLLGMLAYVIFLLLYLLVDDVPLLHARDNGEKWGQFGDYVGGILNPIFSFLTVLLLVGTAQHSREELDVSRKEYNRKQLEDAVQESIKEQDLILSTELEYGMLHVVHSKKFVSLKRFLKADSLFNYRHAKAAAEAWRSNDSLSEDLKGIYAKLDAQIYRLSHLVGDLLVLTYKSSLKDYWLFRYEGCVDECLNAGVLTEEQASMLKEYVFKCYAPDKWL